MNASAWKFIIITAGKGAGGSLNHQVLRKFIPALDFWSNTYWLSRRGERSDTFVISFDAAALTLTRPRFGKNVQIEKRNEQIGIRNQKKCVMWSKEL